MALIDRRGQHSAQDQLCERRRYLALSLQVSLDLLTHGERRVSVPDPLAQRFRVELSARQKFTLRRTLLTAGRGGCRARSSVAIPKHASKIAERATYLTATKK
jgi:hypothetical protein